MSSLIHYSNFAVQAVPSLTVVDKAQVDRIQSLEPTATLNREKNKEVGRDGAVDYSKKTPTVAYRITQNEGQNLSLFEQLANVADSTDMTHASFKNAATDFLAFLTDDDGTVLGTLWYPKLRVAGFSINVSDPDSKIERSFDLVGDAAHAFQGVNKYVIYKKITVDTGELVADDFTVTLNDPAPVEDAAESGKYMFRVTRIRAGVTTDLVTGTGDNQWEYAAGDLTVHAAALADVYKVWYTSGSYISGEALWTDNDTDPGSTLAYNVQLLLGSTELTRIQSCSIDVRFEREDWKEVGNKEVVQRGVKDQTVTITLPRLLESYTLEELLLGQSANFGHIDVENYLDNLTFRLKVFTTDEKTTFAWGMKVTNCTPTEVKTAIAIDGYTNRDLTLEGEGFTLSDSEAIINA